MLASLAHFVPDPAFLVGLASVALWCLVFAVLGAFWFGRKRIAELDKHKDSPVILVCKMGTSASLAGRQLRARGFARVARMQGGIQGWRADNLPVVKA